LPQSYAPALNIVNDFHPFKRRGGRRAFALSCLLHIAAGTLIFFVARKLFVDQLSIGSRAANSNIMQIELQPAAAASAQPALLPPSKPVEVPLEEIQKPAEPEPQTEPVVLRPAEVIEAQVSAEAQTAQVAQEASAPGAQVEAAEPLAGKGQAGEINWQSLAVAKLRAMVEHEKHYPPSAQKAGYTGRFLVRIRLEPDGIISGYEIKERRGHPLLVKAVETTLEKIKGRTIGMTLPERFDILLPIEFELN
jgi:outer membrane biosynthesis protein TonB